MSPTKIKILIHIYHIIDVVHMFSKNVRNIIGPKKIL